MQLTKKKKIILGVAGVVVVAIIASKLLKKPSSVKGAGVALDPVSGLPASGGITGGRVPPIHAPVPVHTSSHGVPIHDAYGNYIGVT